jgi:phenylalanyl-tRNA synthetase beta chain
MKFSLSWLRHFLETDATIDQVTDALTRIGLEVEGIENPADRLSGFTVAKVLTAAPHPQADKLQVLTVDQGDGIPLQVVCGAPNARAGLVGVFGSEGATVPSNGMVLKKTAIRGVESNGMMCSSRELELGDDHDGIIELPSDAPIGIAFADYAKADDPIIDVAITPNRQDCMGVMGIARDLAAAGLGTYKPLAVPDIAGSYPCPTDIRTDDPDGCPAFYGRVIRGVKNGPSPDWMQARLKSAGQRPISALVDCTNYVMLAFGRPAHAYDMTKLTGAVIARRAKDGEGVTALNGKDYTLTSTMTVIAEDTGVHDIAGIMGGEHSGCTEDTTDVLLEIAYFTPDHIAKTGQALSLTSDARTRFERGVDPAFLDDGLAILTDLILRICGGDASDVIRAGAPPVAARRLDYDPALCLKLAGLDVAMDQQSAILKALGFGVVAKGDLLQLTIPSWRRDVTRTVDIVEEIARITGLDAILSTALPRADAVAKPVLTPLQLIERKARRAAAAHGLNEAITWSFLPEKEAVAFGGSAWSLANPISEDMQHMRPSLLPGLLSAAARNRNQGAGSIRLFEIGRCYGAESEALSLAAVMSGDARPRSWQDGKATGFDAFDAKAATLAILEAAGAPVDNLQILAEAPAQYHPGQSGTLALGPKNRIAHFGILHPATAKLFDLDGAVAIVEIHLEAIPAKRASATVKPAFAPPVLQSVNRDFAFLVPRDMPAADLIRAVKTADKTNIVAVRLFDDFRGTGVPEDSKSLAIEVTLQPREASYDEAALKAISDAIIAAATKTGGVLRG